MDINLECNPRESFNLRINGKLVCEGDAALSSTSKEFEMELARARTMNHLPGILEDLVESIKGAGRIAVEGKTSAQKQASFIRGLHEGLEQKLIAHPFDGVPPFKPSEDSAYDRGYQFGEVLLSISNTMKQRRPVLGKAI